MGKIFDAIEKASQEATKNMGSSRTPAKKRTSHNNVVPIKSELSVDAAKQMDPLLVTYHYPDSAESEAFKILRTNILFPKEGKPPRTILVTSAMPGEGKSFVSSNLSISIAQGVEDYVLLIDCDMHKLDIQERFGFKGSPGLSEYLVGKMPLNTLLLKTPVNKLSILAAGTQPRNPTELLSSKKMSELITEVKNRYPDRYVIIDSPPPTVASETIAISQQVDGIIVVIKERGVNRKIVKETLEMIDRTKILGVVFNWSKRKRTKYYYGSKKYGVNS